MSRKVFLVVAALAVPTSASAQAPIDDELGRRIDDVVAPLVALQVFDGSVLLARGGVIVAERSYGLASQEHGIPNGPETAFRIASVSKSFTKALIGRLAARGLLGLDESIARWLPGFPAADRITIRMLLDHRSGVPHMNSLPWDEEAIAQPGLEQLVAAIAERPLDFEPGSDRSYSNGGYALLAHIVELVTGLPFGVALESEVLRPLGLEHTSHEADGAVVPALAAGYMPSPRRPNQLQRAPFQSMDTKAGGGSMVSTPRDLLRWVRAIGRDPLLSAQLWNELFPLRGGMRVMDGRSPGYNSFVQHDVERDLTVVVLSNNYGAGAVGEVAGRLHDLLIDVEPEPLPLLPPAAISRAELRALEGTYVAADWLPEPVRLVEEDGHLVAWLGSAPVDVLVPQGERRFLSRALWSIITFDGATGARATAFEARPLYNDEIIQARRIE